MQVHARQPGLLQPRAEGDQAAHEVHRHRVDVRDLHGREAPVLQQPRGLRPRSQLP